MKMSLVKIKTRTVDAAQIVELQPLFVRGEMKHLDAGVCLRLSDGSCFTWLASAADSSAPAVGDYLIRDTALDVAAIVSAAKFSELFDVE
jgi:hypothetical protein